MPGGLKEGGVVSATLPPTLTGPPFAGTQPVRAALLLTVLEQSVLVTTRWLSCGMAIG